MPRLQFGDKSIQSMEDVQVLMRNLGKWNSAKVSDIMRTASLMMGGLVMK
jgi:hypothetical protein